MFRGDLFVTIAELYT